MSDSAATVFRFGRYVNWVVLALLGASLLYCLWIVIENWRFITV